MLHFKDTILKSVPEKELYVFECLKAYITYRYPDLRPIIHETHFGMFRHMTITRIGGMKIRAILSIRIVTNDGEDFIFTDENYKITNMTINIKKMPDNVSDNIMYYLTPASHWISQHYVENADV